MSSANFSMNVTSLQQLDADTTTDSASAISAHGLTIDAKVLPCFCLFELFEELTRTEKVSRAQIHAKLTAFADYLASKGEQAHGNSLSGLSVLKSSVDMSSVDVESCFFNSTLLNLFAYAFKFRLEVYSESRGILSTQYYGLKHSYIRRVLLTSDSYVLLKKKRISTLRRSNNPNGKLRALRPTLDFKSSTATLATACSQNDSPQSSNVNLFTALQLPATVTSLMSPRGNVATDLQTSICSVEELPDNCAKTPAFSHDASKTTGRLKFFNEAKEYGFIVMEDKTEVFVHKADLLRHNIDTCSLAYYRQYYDIVMEFNVQEYKGREKVNRKAVDLAIRDMIAVC